MICSDIELLCSLLPGLLSEHFSNVLSDTTINLSPAIGKSYTQYAQDFQCKPHKTSLFRRALFWTKQQEQAVLIS